MVPKFLDRGSLGLFLGGGRGGGGGGRGGGGGTLTPNLEEDGMEDGLEEEAEAGQTEGLTYCPGDYVLVLFPLNLPSKGTLTTALVSRACSTKSFQYGFTTID
eukprot:CAMPEP_0178854252 /NCGR_PEP_ID=MMETSP0746-20121128/22739_1 /TAXON_ID=913974 /ORGANISM="Nitzschia punctata, Strain CCMP561" /LENGTH=102 /DNA_ID=CAMNT_0020520237 /DNA_START=114 /DNA_END=420 /DNA_ORIENTATION=-